MFALGVILTLAIPSGVAPMHHAPCLICNYIHKSMCSKQPIASGVLLGRKYHFCAL